jgi:class 3 adenylate cyclase
MVADRPIYTFLFADMAGFTALTEMMGDEEAVGVAEDFFAGARALLPGHGATEVKTIGDAMMVEVVEAGEAIGLGLALARPSESSIPSASTFTDGALSPTLRSRLRSTSLEMTAAEKVHRPVFARIYERVSAGNGANGSA